MMILSYIKHLCIGLAFLLTMFCFGKIIYQVLRFNSRLPEKYASYFYYLLGYISVVIISSLIVTKGNTVFSGALLITIIYLFYSLKDNFNFTFNFSKSEVNLFLVSFSFFCVTYSLNFFRYYSFDINDFFIKGNDQIFYGRLSHNIFVTGIESNLGLNDWFLAKGSTPYHFSELWLTAIGSYIFDVNNIVFHLIITYSIGASLISYGLYLFFDKINIYVSWLLSIFAIFTSNSAIITNLLEGKLFLIENAVVWTSGSWQLSKLFPVSIFIIGFIFIYFKSNVGKYGFFFLSILPFIYFTLIPAVFIFSFIFILILLFKKRKLDFLYILPLLSVIFVGIYYYVFRSSEVNHLNQSIDYLNLLTNKMQTIKSIMFYCISNPLEILLTYIIYLPIFIFILFFKTNCNICKVFLISFFSTFFLVALLSGTLYFMADSWQLLANFMVPIFNILVIIGVYYLILNFNKNIYTGILLFIYFIYFIFINYNMMLHEYKSMKISNYERKIYALKNKFKGSGYILYWGAYNEKYITPFSSLLINGLYNPVNFMSVYDINTWIVNVRLMNKSRNYRLLYPYSLIKQNSSIINLNKYLSSNSCKYLLCDYELKNEFSHKYFPNHHIIYLSPDFKK